VAGFAVAPGAHGCSFREVALSAQLGRRRFVTVLWPRPGGSEAVLSCGAVETASRAGTNGDILIVRAVRACKHGAQMDVEIPGGRL
jgi:hypothetical protein